MVGAVPWYFDVVKGPIQMIDGFWQISTEPGLGVDVNEKECARHLYEPETPHTINAVLDDRTVADW